MTKQTIIFVTIILNIVIHYYSHKNETRFQNILNPL